MPSAAPFDASTLPRFSRSSVASHNTAEDLYCIVDAHVYDLSDFLDAHPGGSVVLAQVAGTDATTQFYNLHRHEVIEKYRPSLCIGLVEGETPQIIERLAGDLIPVPYAEPLWLRPQYKSPYYKDTHHALRRKLREFVDAEIRPEAQEKEADGTYISQELIDKMAKNGLLAMRLGPGKHLHGQKLLGGVVSGEEFNYFHDLIVAQEISRANARGFQDGNMAGMFISLTAVREWMGNEELKKKVTDEVLSGRKKICLAISEAFAGSDVAGIKTTATPTKGGWIVNGTKKWITNGMFCTHFVTACKTDKGLTVLLIERGEGVETKRIKTSYSTTAGTAYIQFEDVFVPHSHILGVENQGIKVVLSNFNHERWGMVCMTARWCRTITTECLQFSTQRIVNGKPLTSLPVIRAKLARMISLCEAMQAWLESITDQMCQMSYAEQSDALGGPIGLLKSFCTQGAGEVASMAVNIFGGRGLTQGGMGKLVEQWHRTYKFDSVLGGTEEVLMDLGVRQAMKKMPKSML